MNKQTTKRRGRPPKNVTARLTTAKGAKEAWSARPKNRDVAERMIIPSDNYKNLNCIQGVDPVVKISNLRDSIFRENSESDRQRMSIEDYAHLIYGWLVLNPHTLSVLDFYNCPKDNAPFIYTYDEILEYDSDEIYNLLQERIATLMMRKQIDREAALAVLREKYGWQREEQTLNLNTANVSFKFGDNNLTMGDRSPMQSEATDAEHEQIEETTQK